MANAPAVVVTLDGQLRAPGEPLLYADDLAAVRGDGIFETLLVRDGEAPFASAHLARIAASAAALYGCALPDDLAARVDAAAAGPDAVGALRVVVTPEPGGGAVVALERGRPRARALPIVLRPFTLPGGLGAHKWRDRGLLDALAAADPDGATPLLLDGDGCVLEAAWGNVFALAGDVLTTPPADGRILPGVTRAAVLAAAPELGLAPCERPLPIERLARADAIAISSSLVGVVPAVLAAAAPDAGTFALAERLMRRLGQRTATPVA